MSAAISQVTTATELPCRTRIVYVERKTSDSSLAVGLSLTFLFIAAVFLFFWYYWIVRQRGSPKKDGCEAAATAPPGPGDRSKRGNHDYRQSLVGLLEDFSSNVPLRHVQSKSRMIVERSKELCHWIKDGVVRHLPADLGRPSSHANDRVTVTQETSNPVNPPPSFSTPMEVSAMPFPQPSTMFIGKEKTGGNSATAITQASVSQVLVSNGNSDAGGVGGDASRACSVHSRKLAFYRPGQPAADQLDDHSKMEVSCSQDDIYYVPKSLFKTTDVPEIFGSRANLVPSSAVSTPPLTLMSPNLSCRNTVVSDTITIATENELQSDDDVYALATFVPGTATMATEEVHALASPAHRSALDVDAVTTTGSLLSSDEDVYAVATPTSTSPLTMDDGVYSRQGRGLPPDGASDDVYYVPSALGKAAPSMPTSPRASTFAFANSYNSDLESEIESPPAADACEEDIYACPTGERASTAADGKAYRHHHHTVVSQELRHIDGRVVKTANNALFQISYDIYE